MYSPMGKSGKYSYKIVLILSLLLMLMLLYHCTSKNGPLTTTDDMHHTANSNVNYPNYTKSELDQIESVRECYRIKEHDERLVFLDDILQSPPKPDKAIFFINTSCAKNGSRVTLNSRQACSIESAAKWNTNRDIFVLFVAKVGFVPDEQPSTIVNALKSYPNIHFRNVDLYKYSIGTAGEHWIKKDLIFSTSYHLAHLSDYLRFLTLLKYGGIYLDMDVFVQKSFEGFPPNFGGVEDPNSINCAVLGLEATGIGHQISEMVVKENTENYKPYDWPYNGPGALSRVLSKICHCPKRQIYKARPEYCWGFKVFPQSEFYAIHYSQSYDIINTDEKAIEMQLKKIENSTAVHVWNSHTHINNISKSERTIYLILAQKNSPKVYEASPSIF